MHDSDPKWFTTWSLGPVFRHRDSDNIQEANANSLLRYLESDPGLREDWEIVGCSHWAVGHVDHLAFKVLTEMSAEEKALAAEHKDSPTEYFVPSYPGYKLTRIARVLTAWFDGLEQYPVADDSELSRIEYEASLEAIRDQAPPRGRELKDDLPDDWVESVYSKLWRTGAIDTSGQGAWCDEDELAKVLDELKFLKPEYEDDE